MDKYDDLFASADANQSIFSDKSALDPLATPETVYARADQERALARILRGVEQGYLPTTVSIYGPPGTGKTLTTRRVCSEFAARTSAFAFEYINLKQCRTLFSAGNEILLEVAGEQKEAYAGLDGVFSAIWDALEGYPDWTVLILDEIDQIRYDTHYDPNDFFYRFLRGEEKLSRGLNLSLFLLSNELLEVDLRLDSRVQSAMSDEKVFFPPYDKSSLTAVVTPRIEAAFVDRAFPESVRSYAIGKAATHWGDARRTLTLCRRAGELAVERGFGELTHECIDDSLETTEKDAIVTKLSRLPLTHFQVLLGTTVWHDPVTGDRVPSVPTSKITRFVNREEFPDEFHLSDRMIRDRIDELETMGLVETWIESRGADGRAKHVQPTFDPDWMQDAQHAFAAYHDLSDEDAPS